jgi:TM2 domain-containing membrane protein YozV
MSNYRIRPRFRLESDLSVKQIQLKVFEHIKREDVLCEAEYAGNLITIKVPKDQRNLWSPQLALSIDEDDEKDKTAIRGLFGPDSTPWIIYAALYAALGTAILFFTIFGLAQVNMGEEAPILWLLIPLWVAAIGMYMVSRYGQRKNAHQVQSLINTFENALSLKIEL